MIGIGLSCAICASCGWLRRWAPNVTPASTRRTPGTGRWRGGSDPTRPDAPTCAWTWPAGTWWGRSPLASDPTRAPPRADRSPKSRVSDGASRGSSGPPGGQRKGQRGGHRAADALAPSIRPRQRTERAVVEREDLGDKRPTLRNAAPPLTARRRVERPCPTPAARPRRGVLAVTGNASRRTRRSPPDATRSRCRDRRPAPRCTGRSSSGPTSSPPPMRVRP